MDLCSVGQRMELLGVSRQSAFIRRGAIWRTGALDMVKVDFGLVRMTDGWEQLLQRWQEPLRVMSIGDVLQSSPYPKW